MNCQRHNAESCRRALEQKLKDKERDSQKVRQQPVSKFILLILSPLESFKNTFIVPVTLKELTQLQSSNQNLEQQLDQVRNKLTQELQQSKKESNVLQADIEKVTLRFYFSALPFLD